MILRMVKSPVATLLILTKATLLHFSIFSTPALSHAVPHLRWVVQILPIMRIETKKIHDDHRLSFIHSHS